MRVAWWCAQVQQALDRIDEDCSGEIDREEWSDGLLRNQDLLVYFEEVIFGKAGRGGSGEHNVFLAEQQEQN